LPSLYLTPLQHLSVSLHPRHISLSLHATNVDSPSMGNVLPIIKVLFPGNQKSD
jgi:hypothetical protein